VDALTRTTLGDMELPEPGERHFGAAGERALDRVEKGVDRVAGLFLAKVGLARNLLDEL
jgi:hypothetical protein